MIEANAIGGTITTINLVVQYTCSNLLQCMVDYNISEICVKGFCYVRVI